MKNYLKIYSWASEILAKVGSSKIIRHSNLLIMEWETEALEVK